MCMVHESWNARLLTSVSNEPDDLEASISIQFRRGPIVLAKPLIPHKVCGLRRMYKVAQSYNEMTWQR